MGIMKTHCKPPKTTTWLTPPELIDALGPFDLDPCCPPVMPWRTAARMIQEPECGLTTEWPRDAFVWMNPPFSRGERERWMEKLANHPGGGIMLVPAATETKAFQNYVLGWDNTSVFWLRGRPHFYNEKGERARGAVSGPVCLVAYGYTALYRLWNALAARKIEGFLHD